MSESAIISHANGRLKTAFLALLIAGILGCSQSDESQEDENAPGHPLVGQILSVDTEAGRLEVAHEDIPGFMPAMTMRFEVDPGDAANAREGQRIRARLIRTEEGGVKLIRIWPLDENEAKDLKTANRALQRQAQALPSGRYYGQGDAAPDFGLYDHRGQLVTSDRFKGQPFFLNFIFTRCPDPEMCSASTMKMGQLRQRVEEAGLEAAFVSITLDPEFDTPGVLRQYAEAYGIESENVHFVTGPKPAVRNLIRSYGVTAIENVDTIMHSMATTLVAADGSIALRSETRKWSVDEFFEAMQGLSQ